MNKKYSGETLDSALEKASRELNISKENLNYKVLKSKKKFFAIKAKIEIEVSTEQDEIKEKEIINKPLKEIDGYAYVKDGEVIVVNPKEEGEYPEIIPCEDVLLKINSTLVKEAKEIKEEDIIELSIVNREPSRKFQVEVDPKGKEALLTVTYKKGYKYKLKDTERNTTLLIQKELEEIEEPPLYTKEEILNDLKNKKVIFGIIHENIEEAIKEGSDKLIIAKGVETVDDTDDIIKVNFQNTTKNGELKEDETGKVDFKSIGHVVSAKKGDVIAELIQGKIGTNGKNIFGVETPKKLGKKMTIVAGENAVLEFNKVKASVDGRPSGDKNIFSIHLVHVINGDVDMRSGNIKFTGDIIINGSVRENMEVDSSNNVSIQGDVLDGKINGSGLISIGKNVIHSKIINGSESVEKHQFLEKLEKFTLLLTQLEKIMKSLLRENAIGNNVKVIDIINKTVDKKIPEINKISKFLSSNQEFCGTKISLMLKEQFPEKRQININKFSQLEKTIKVLEEKVREMKDFDMAMNNIEFSYCQDSTLKCTGDIIVSGKGEYISELVAGNEIIFSSPKSVARGGKLSAKTIRCGIVGSEAGVNTVLKVPKNGHIYAEVVYINTKFKIGDKEKLITENMRQVHSYINKQGDIEIEKFKL